MARYIDADKAHEGIEAIQTSLESNDDREWRKNKPYYKGLAWARGVIDETPTADVAPRAEVAREIFAELTKSVLSKLPMSIRLIFKDDRNYDDGFRDGKGDALIEVLVLIDDLKKKYTEGEK